jgi:hypothetical protein
MKINFQTIRQRISARKYPALALVLVIGSSGCGVAGRSTTTTPEPTLAENVNADDTSSNSATAPTGLPANSKVLSWELGNKLSLAALLYDMNGAENSDSLKKAKTLATTVDAEVPPFPPKTGNKAKDSAAIASYLLNEAGKPIIQKIKEKHGSEHSQLFEMSLKSNLLLMLYGPGEAEGKAISGVIKRNGTRLNLPENLWQPVVAKVEAEATYAEVKDAVFQMQQHVGKYLATQG